MIDRETLRALIRDVVAAEVAAAKAQAVKAQAVKAQAVKAQAAKAQAGQRGVPAERPAAATAVRIATDADLAAFARQVLALAGDPAVRAAIEAGRHPFRLLAGAATGAPPPRAAGAPAPRPAGPARITAGVVTEKTLVALPRGTSVLEVGPEVAVTPLARDKARSLKITIERIRP